MEHFEKSRSRLYRIETLVVLTWYPSTMDHRTSAKLKLVQCSEIRDELKSHQPSITILTTSRVWGSIQLLARGLL